MSHRNLGWLLGVSAMAVLALAVAYSVPTHASWQKRGRDYEYQELFADVIHQVRSKYVQELDADRERKLVEDMINGGLERLDPHSQFINAKEYKQFSKHSEGKFGGVGIQIGYDRQGRGQLQVISPMPGTPAYEAGVLAGDLITKIDGKSTENMRLSEAVDLIQGEPGQKVVLTVVHEGGKEPVDIPIVRAEIEVHAVMGDRRKADDPKEWELFIDKENKIGYIRLVAFSRTAAAEMRKAVEQLEKDGARGLIIDLRNNPGGLLSAAVEISDLFLTDGVIVSTKGRNQHEDVRRAKGPGTLMQPAEKYPIVVLINKYSASASEIVAAALQDHKRAVVIGERSYGKGSVQNIIEMENHSSALKLTTQSYWRPSGKNIHRFPDAKETDEWGVKPDPGFEVPMKDDERLEYMVWRSERDVVRGKNAGPKPEKPNKPKSDKPDKKPFEDRVMQKALEYLRGEIKKLNAEGPTPFELRNG
ncbi:MAG TPA: S41 family peptidase [Gemmataceae bacterium]|nr:S41 family peptidase [Gemmataceae bacterium]